MQCNWLGERVATVDVDRAITNVINNKEDAGWGPNAVFRFPTSGGTGAIWKGVAKLLPADKQVKKPQDGYCRALLVMPDGPTPTECWLQTSFVDGLQTLACVHVCRLTARR